MTNLKTVKPDIIGIGGQRCGSTSIYRYLSGVTGAKLGNKEIHFFDRKRKYGWNWYYSHFAEQQFNIDFTPGYSILGRRIISEIKENIPDAKIVFIARNPINRVLSVLKANTIWYPNAGKVFDSNDLLLSEVEKHARDRRSQYARIILSWRKFYGDQFYLYYFDDLVDAPDDFAANLSLDLGVPVGEGGIRRSNRSPGFRIDPLVYEWLIDYFEPKIKCWNRTLDSRIVEKWLCQVEDLRKEIRQ